MDDATSESVYFDESVHDAYGFIVGAFVFGDAAAISRAVESALLEARLTPGVDEFKSRLPFEGNLPNQRLRDRLVGFVSQNVKVGLAIVPRTDRERLGELGLRALAHLAWKNHLGSQGLAIYFDEGLFRSVAEATSTAHRIGFPENFRFSFEADSRFVGGLQLADLVASAAARIVSEYLTGHPKVVLLGERDGYQDGTPASLSWCLKMMLRYSFLCGRLLEPPVDETGKYLWDLPLMDMRSFAVYAAPGLPAEVDEAVEAAFGKVWLGCIH